MRKTLAIFAALFFGCQAFAEDSDELQALELQLEMLQTAESVNYLLSQVRDNVRPSDAVEHVTGISHSGWAIRRANELMHALAKSVESTSPALKRLEDIGKATDVTKKIATFLKLVSDMERMQNSNTESWGEKTAIGLANALDGITKILPLPAPVKMYISRLTGAIKGMAEDIAKMEARTKETNWAIEEADRAIGGWQEQSDQPVVDDQQRTAVQVLQDAIRERREAINQEEYAKVSAAREECYEAASTNHRDFFLLGLRRDKVRSAIDRLESAEDRLENIRPYLRAEIGVVKADILNKERKLGKPGVSVDLTNIKIGQLRMRLNILEKEIRPLESRAGRLPSAIRSAKDKFKELNDQIDDIEKCVRDRLKDEEFPEGYLEENFPQYTALVIGEGDPSSINVDTGAQHASGPPTGDEWHCLPGPSPMESGSATSFKRSYRISVAEGEERTIRFTASRGTEVEVFPEILEGAARVLLYRLEKNEQGEENWTWVQSETYTWAHSAEQKYKVRIFNVAQPTKLSIRIVGTDLGDLGLHSDAPSDGEHAVDIPLGVYHSGTVSNSDREDMYRVPYVDAFTRIRVTVVETDEPTFGRNVMVYVSSQICDGDGNVQSYLGVESGTVTSVRPGESGFVDYITDTAGHFLILVRRGYGSTHSYRIKVEILRKEPIWHNGRIIGYLGRREPGWYALYPGSPSHLPGPHRNMGDFGDRQSAVDWLIELAR